MKYTIGKNAPRSHLKGWQTLTEAAAQSGKPRQQIHLWVQANRVSHRKMFGLILVPAPLIPPKRKRRANKS